MKRYALFFVIVFSCTMQIFAQTEIVTAQGNCGVDVKWTFDGFTLNIFNTNKKSEKVFIDDYDMDKIRAPWIKKSLDIRKVVIGKGITRIGSCAFAKCGGLQEVVFQGTDLTEIGWGAFYGCQHMYTMSLPVQLREIGTIAFAKCEALSAVKIPNQCKVADQAFVSCTKLKSLEIGATAILGSQVFATEKIIDNKVKHVMYNGEISRIPAYVNMNNCNEYGLGTAAVAKIKKGSNADADYDNATSEVDKDIPVSISSRINTYALIIGNQNYRFVSDVPYAIHDARVFAEYCKQTLGIPTGNIHISEDATKQMILEEELDDWVSRIQEKEDKNLIVYYAGHGVPDIKNSNKAYLLPTDVRGTNPQRGIALDEFYEKIGAMGFQHTSVLLDACFSGMNRNNEGVAEGLRGVEIEAEEATLNNGNMIVLSAAQGNETAQGFPEQGHGLFTYFLLKEIQKSRGIISCGELFDNIMDGVSQQSMQLRLRKHQTPAVKTTTGIVDTWRSFMF